MWGTRHQTATLKPRAEKSQQPFILNSSWLISLHSPYPSSLCSALSWRMVHSHGQTSSCPPPSSPLYYPRFSPLCPAAHLSRVFHSPVLNQPLGTFAYENDGRPQSRVLSESTRRGPCPGQGPSPVVWKVVTRLQAHSWTGLTKIPVGLFKLLNKPYWELVDLAQTWFTQHFITLGDDTIHLSIWCITECSHCPRLGLGYKLKDVCI